MKLTGLSRIHLLFLVGVEMVLLSCCGIPDNFPSLSLANKISTYACYLNTYGRPRRYARSWISWHGWSAADLMSEYLSGTKTGFPKSEAIEIIDLVQVRGCPLRGTAAEKALEHFTQSEPAGSLDNLIAKSALDSIRRNVVTPGGPDHLRGGPCQEAHGSRP